MKTKILLMIFAAFVLLPSVAFADGPATMPVQGVLTDASDAPITDTVAVTFTIYGTSADAGAVVHTEVISVDVDRGFFSVMLGAGATTLDLDIFRNGAAELGIKVGSDAEMTPRLELGGVPFAAHARTAEVASDSLFLNGKDLGDFAAQFVDAGESNSITSAMIQNNAVTTAKIPNYAVTTTKVANAQKLYRVSSVYCEQEPGTLMTVGSCRASQHNASTCTIACGTLKFPVRNCDGACACSNTVLCIIGQPCDYRRAFPSCSNTEIGVAIGN